MKPDYSHPHHPFNPKYVTQLPSPVKKTAPKKTGRPPGRPRKQKD